MKITDLLDPRHPFPSLEIVPPLSGISKDQLLDSIEPLMEFSPRYINVTTHRDEFQYVPQADGSFQRKIVRSRVSPVAVCAAIQGRYKVEVVPHVICAGNTAAEIDAEIEIKLNALKEQKGKLPPEQALVGIKKGMAGKFCTQICLMKQDYVADGEVTVEKYLDGVSKTLGAPITVKRFVRLQLGA